jgi:hypothetical protein
MQSPQKNFFFCSKLTWKPSWGEERVKDRIMIIIIIIIIMIIRIMINSV